MLSLQARSCCIGFQENQYLRGPELNTSLFPQLFQCSFTPKVFFVLNVWNFYLILSCLVLVVSLSYICPITPETGLSKTNGILNSTNKTLFSTAVGF